VLARAGVARFDGAVAFFFVVGDFVVFVTFFVVAFAAVEGRVAFDGRAAFDGRVVFNVFVVALFMSWFGGFLRGARRVSDCTFKDASRRWAQTKPRWARRVKRGPVWQRVAPCGTVRHAVVVGADRWEPVRHN
jgi:hypothetical protein